MVVLVDDENSISVRRLRQASPVGAKIYRSSHEEAASETKVRSVVRGNPMNDHADEHMMRTTAPTKPSHPMT